MSCDGGPRTRRSNGLRAKLALSMGSVAVGLILGECLVRWLGVSPEVAVIQKGRYRLSSNPRLGYEPAPGVDFTGGRLDFFDYAGRSNSLGFRDVEHEERSAPGVYRIVVLGDSVAAGLGVARTEDVFPAVLSRRLNEAGLKAEVISLAVSGYNTQQEVEILKSHGLRFHPNLVLIAYCLNDRNSRDDGGILDSLLEAERRQGGIGRLLGHPLLNRSALYRFVRYRVAAGRSRPRDLVGGDTVEESMRELARLARERRFEVLVVVFPLIVFPRPYPQREEHAWVTRVAKENGFHVLDLLQPFQQCSRESAHPLGLDTVHPSVEGHRCAAEAMATRLLDAGPRWAGRVDQAR